VAIKTTYTEEITIFVFIAQLGGAWQKDKNITSIDATNYLHGVQIGF
jgi:hypothetical protein